MLLTVDAGNTETTLGLFEDEDLVRTWRFATQTARTPDELFVLFQAFLALERMSFDRTVAEVAIASVVPRVTQSLREMVQRYLQFEPLIVGPGVRTGMPVLIDNPREVGADRIMGAVAAYEIYGGPAIVIDLGTATTFDAVSEGGEYLGGAIAPGPHTAAQALVAGAAQLERVEFAPPRRLIGKSTAEALQSGIVLGYASLIEGMVARFRTELGAEARTVLTGGLADQISPNLSIVDEVDPWLVLRGLRIVTGRNRTPQ
ncbi:MAG TPA: type III pantothenate kinase [Actinomycetota bacterium]|nr:type III pantothenate kinase [Actinomycetota bacterium]